jgi:hypothetical protein
VDVISSLVFSRGRAIDATLDGQPLNEALGHPGMYGLDDDEWRITARTLQGWMPQELGLERRKFVPIGEPIGKGRFRSVPVRPVAQVLLTLPGGDRPEVLAEGVDSLVDYDSVPLLSCACGGGVGCGHEAVSVSFERTRVRWTHGELDFSFARTSYDRAIETLLTLVGERPRLITADEWLEPMQTRVVATP